MTERESCIILNMVSGIGFVKFNALSSFFGSPVEALKANMSELMLVRGIGEQLAQRIFAAQQEVDLEAELRRAELGGVGIITIYDAEYPEVLRQIPDPPICLYVSGRLPDFERNNFLAVVGSRRCSSYGIRAGRSISEQAVLAKWGTVSGLAFGIDFHAHDATVKAKGVTVAVLGGGLGRIHPQEHVPLARSIVESGGALVSEYPMMFPVSRNSFPRRNRIIAALARGVMVVEANVESGAMITANLAIDYGKTLFAVPGAIDNPMAAGCHRLIKRGEAKLVESFADVIEEFDITPSCDLFSFRENPKEYEAKATFTAPEQKIIDYLTEHGESSFDALSLAMEFPPGQLSSLLSVLEMRFVLLQNPGRRYQLR